MKPGNKLLTAFVVLLALSFTASTGFASWDSADEVRRLNREAPSLDGFEGAEGLVWLENTDYKVRLDGSMEKASYLVVIIGETVPETLADIRIPIPQDGSADIIDASWYNPMTSVKEGSLPVETENLPGGASVLRISVPGAAAGRAVVLAVREIHPKKYGSDGCVAMAGPLPRWEQNLTVEVDEGMELAWIARDAGEPRMSKGGSVVGYKWTVMNQQAWHGEGFVEYKRPFVAFGTKKGKNNAVSVVAELASSIKAPPLPSFAGTGDKAKTGARLMSWIAEPARTLRGYPRSWVRTNAQIPDEGPWTPWEQTLILNKWLSAIGWNTEVWWQAAAELGDDSPAALDLFTAPVLRLTADSVSNKRSYYQAGQAADFGATAPSVTAAALYRLNQKGEAEKKTVGPGAASDHRLTMLWKLRLGEDGVAGGALEVTVTGGWTELFSEGQLPEEKALSAFLTRRINFAMPGLELTPKEVKRSGTGYKMEFGVKCAPGIVHGGNLLLRLPGGVPQRLGEMIGREDEYTFCFPFIIDQKVRMKMPRGYKMVQPPAIVDRGAGSKASLKQSITHWPKKAELLADSTWIVKTRTVDVGLSILLKEELAASLRWPVLNLPFRK